MSDIATKRREMILQAVDPEDAMTPVYAARDETEKTSLDLVIARAKYHRHKTHANDQAVYRLEQARRDAEKETLALFRLWLSRGDMVTNTTEEFWHRQFAVFRTQARKDITRKGEHAAAVRARRANAGGDPADEAEEEAHEAEADEVEVEAEEAEAEVEAEEAMEADEAEADKAEAEAEEASIRVKPVQRKRKSQRALREQWMRARRARHAKNK